MDEYLGAWKRRELHKHHESPPVRSRRDMKEYCSFLMIPFVRALAERCASYSRGSRGSTLCPRIGLKGGDPVSFRVTPGARGSLSLLRRVDAAVVAL
jgi:hypothetical protein